ncbi:hypothetical protein HON36_04060 [Candidatus Parcubacteria bacterium]|jgi:hypothetical protein|nr:hypothetical protein [Candidatus Parcubacteria bacterium]MBT7228259.1 hypothetical protein [Candidatus Parcubacteria bacterium]
MFDDLKKDENTQTPQPTTPQPVVPVSPQPTTPQPAAPAAPVGGGIDDMFADVDPAPASAVEKPSAIQSGKITPISQNNPPPAPGQPPAGPSASDMIVADGGGGGPLKKIIAIIIVIFILGLAGGAVYYFMNKNTEDTGGENINVTNDIPEDNSNTNDNTNDNDFDDDFDGLSNAEEKSLGTDINNADTDNDGLFDAQEVNEYNTNPLISDTDLDGLTDYEEVETYATDPNKADTDGDGYQDGVEVGNGYNPLGEGMLGGGDIDTISGDDMVYIPHQNVDFGFSINRPGTWTIYESDSTDEGYNMSEVQFWPGVFGIGSHHIRVTSARMQDFTEEQKQEYLAIEDSWEDYTIGGLPAYMSLDRYRVLLFRPTAEEGTVDFFVLIYDYSLAGEPNAEYMIIFQEMLSSFTFLNEQ